MFVSSYNTFFHTQTTLQNTPKKSTKKEGGESFSYNRLTTSLSKEEFSSSLSSFLFTDDAQSLKAFQNKLKIQYQLQKEKTLQKEPFSKQAPQITQLGGLKNLSVSDVSALYAQNAQPYSAMKKPSHPLIQTPKNNKIVSKEFQKAQEKVLREKMIHTYQENEEFFTLSA